MSFEFFKDQSFDEVSSQPFTIDAQIAAIETDAVKITPVETPEDVEFLTPNCTAPQLAQDIPVTPPTSPPLAPKKKGILGLCAPCFSELLRKKRSKRRLTSKRKHVVNV